MDDVTTGSPEQSGHLEHKGRVESNSWPDSPPWSSNGVLGSQAWDEHPDSIFKRAKILPHNWLCKHNCRRDSGDDFMGKLKRYPLMVMVDQEAKIVRWGLGMTWRKKPPRSYKEVAAAALGCEENDSSGCSTIVEPGSLVGITADWVNRKIVELK